jgi:hypothetical protein
MTATLVRLVHEAYVAAGLAEPASSTAPNGSKPKPKRPAGKEGRA